MINLMSRHVVRLVKMCLEFHLCVCSMFAVFFSEMASGIPLPGRAPGGCSFQFGGVEGLRLITTEMSVQPKHNMSVQAAVWYRYRCIIQ